MKIGRDNYEAITNTIGNIFPFLNDYNLIKPYSTTKKNCDELKRRLIEYLKVADDENSFYSQIKNWDKFTEDELVSDLILLLFAGSDTTNHTLAGMIYFIKKYPNVYEKIKAEYEKYDLITKDGLQKDNITLDYLEKCEYAEYVVKETLRLEHVAPETVYNEIIEDTEIWGVPIQKGCIIAINMYGPHFNPQEWHEPLKFIPERFDPEDKYFTSPKTNKARDSYSYIPFSIGVRACPGQTLARLVLKASLPFFIASMDYTINKEQLENDKIFFNNNSQYNLKLTITNKRI